MTKDIIIDEKCFPKNDTSMMFIDINQFILENKDVNKEVLIKLIDDYNLDINKSPDINFSKIITYFNSEKYTFNTTLINNILQDKYNPNGNEIPNNSKFESKFTFRVQDSIVRTENDYSSSTMRANGDTAKINSIEGSSVTITYNDKKFISEKININELYDNFILNYAISIHKSQGSQYTNVIFFIEPNQTIINKSAIYTAISRAKGRCIIISNMEDFKNCQLNTKNDEKKVSLFMKESNTYELL
jgi:exodeoxyribonuclease V alpha subunit